MTTSPGSPGPWRAIRQLPSRTPLRVKLITAVLALVALALVLISVAGISFLKSYLLAQADNQLRVMQTQIGDHHEFRAGGGGIAGPSGPERYINGAVVSGRYYPSLADPSSGFQTPTWGSVGPDVQPVAAWLARHNDQPITVGAKSGPAKWRIAGFPGFTFASPGTGQQVQGTLVVGVDVSTVYSTIERLTIIDIVVSTMIIIALAAVGTGAIRASLRPLADIERTAGQIAAGDLTRRIPDRDPRTEIGRLGRSLNSMLEQIETAFRAQAASEEAARQSEEAARRSAITANRSEEKMRQFVADASHELRTPLTAIRGFAEYYRQRGGIAPAPAEGPGSGGPDSGGLNSAGLDRLMRRVEQEAARMGVLVEDMLLLARLDQQRPLDQRTVDLLAIAADALHDARVMAPDRTINLTVDTIEAPLVTGDEVRLRQVVGNLMSNAMMHTPAGTPVEITLRSGPLGTGTAPSNGHPDGTEPAIILEVTDSGPGLTPEQQERVFERFYRTDRSRNRAAGGTGLGLAIVAALVTAHHGRVWVRSTPGEGATFGFAIPQAPEARRSGDEDYEHGAEPEFRPDADAADADRPAAADPAVTDPGVTDPGAAAVIDSRVSDPGAATVQDTRRS
ncbi:MAG: HAMP domain-containing sensor histidine kinase [Actinomycetota bacterium]|nr:HAMP domain-containing sensor histidine kinase [Actinomycetota bacterium]